MNRRTLPTALVLVAAVATGCSVPTNDEPAELSGTIPFGLLETTTTTTSSVPEAVTKQVTVYFLDTSGSSARLVPVPRDVDVGAGVEEVLGNLFSSRPDGEERPAEAGLSSSIPESATLLSVTGIAGTTRVVVDVRGLFGNEGIQGVDLRNALAQIVWTATADESVSEVSFQNDGESVQALVDGGEIVEEPVTRSDYRRTG